MKKKIEKLVLSSKTMLEFIDDLSNEQLELAANELDRLVQIGRASCRERV